MLKRTTLGLWYSALTGGGFLLLLALKLRGSLPVATWSWWRVTAPLWLPWAALLVVAAGVLVSSSFFPKAEREPRP